MDDIDQLIRFTPQESSHFEKEQNLFSIIKTMDYLEFAYMNGRVAGDKYDTEWRALFHQYSMVTNTIGQFEGLDSFVKRMHLNHC